MRNPWPKRPLHLNRSSHRFDREFARRGHPRLFCLPAFCSWRNRTTNNVSLYEHSGGLLLSILGFILWWAFYSRTPGKDRVMVLLVFIAAAVVVANLIPPSHIMGLLLYAFPLVAVLCVGWLITSQPFSWQLRRSVLLLLIMMGWSTMLLVRIKNVNGDMIPDLRWVWSKTSDELREEESASRKAGKQDDAPYNWSLNRETGQNFEAPIEIARPLIPASEPIGKKTRRNCFGNAGSVSAGPPLALWEIFFSRRNSVCRMNA